MFCYRCKKEIPLEGKPRRQQTCPHCSSYVHCCLNCRFYDRLAASQCREPQAELVRDKEMANFCDYFEPSAKAPESDNRAAEARKKLDALFKKDDRDAS